MPSDSSQPHRAESLTTAAGETQPAYPDCFGCGDANPIGLRLRYRWEGERLTTEFTPGEVHQGWPGIVHGGIITTLLYEGMENLAFHGGTTTMMRSMQTRFRRPARVGERIMAAAWMLAEQGRTLIASAALTDADGNLIAEGSAELVPITQKRIERLGIDKPAPAAH